VTPGLDLDPFSTYGWGPANIVGLPVSSLRRSVLGALRRFALVPSLELPAKDGGKVSLWGYKHTRPVILVFCQPADRHVLQDLARRYHDYREAGAEVVAVTPQAPAIGELAFPVLVDADGHETARFVEHTPSILVLDSYNALYERYEGPWPQGVPHHDLLESLAQVEMQCPECGAPEWPT